MEMRRPVRVAAPARASLGKAAAAGVSSGWIWEQVTSAASPVPPRGSPTFSPKLHLAPEHFLPARVKPILALPRMWLTDTRIPVRPTLLPTPGCLPPAPRRSGALPRHRCLPLSPSLPLQTKLFHGGFYRGLGSVQGHTAAAQRCSPLIPRAWQPSWISQRVFLL